MEFLDSKRRISRERSGSKVDYNRHTSEDAVWRITRIHQLSIDTQWNQ